MWKYYVYELADPRDGATFYVGKGCGDRLDHHEVEAKKGIDSRKCNRIREIIGAGLPVQKTKIAYFQDEKEAYQFENERIKEYGRTNLCNVAPLRNGPRAAVNPYKSYNFMRIMAYGFLFRAGAKKPPRGMFASALYRALMEKFDNFIEIAISNVGFDGLRDGVRPFGVDLRRGC
jgi:hypothetical protein